MQELAPETFPLLREPPVRPSRALPSASAQPDGDPVGSRAPRWRFLRSIRVRIALSVFVLLAVVQATLMVFVLERFRRGDLRELDSFLVREVSDVQALLGTPYLKSLVGRIIEHESRSDALFFQVQSESGEPIYPSSGPPDSRFGGRLLEEEQRPGYSGMRFEYRALPGSGTQHERIRMVEAHVEGHVIRVGRTLHSVGEAYQALLLQLVYGLIAVSLFGALGAWVVVQRALAPVSALGARARELEASLAGELPHTGSGDEIDQLAGVLNEMLGRIRAEVERVRRLTGDAAHALRTPIAVIRGMLEMQVRSDRRAQIASLVPVLEAVDELTASVNQLLLLERLESKGIEANRAERLDLGKVAHDVVDALQIVSEDRGLKVACAIQPAWVYGDVLQLRNAIANLLDNALRHTLQGGRIDVTVEASGAHAVLAVCDTGPGLRPDQLERVFERFYSERAGTAGGLGLTIARAIAIAHGGSLRASSPGGARFELRLPLSAA